MATPRIDPLEAAGVVLSNFSVDELDEMWRKPDGGQQKLHSHLEALDQVGRIDEEVLMSIVQGA